ncbi:MAG TPA: flagellar hook-basal body complex protein FliE [Stellaceae bacterium]|nr:flagellar hook-basal body complex protein FliE [Stellaceae bacterium]
MATIGTVGNAINAYTNAARIASNTPPTAGTESFGKLLQNAATSTLDTLKQGEAASLQAVAGNADLASVTQAVTDAQVALQTVVAVRDRVISAYQDIIKMPI